MSDRTPPPYSPTQPKARVRIPYLKELKLKAGSGRC